MAKIKAVIFDFDGLMVNTQELLARAYDEFLLAKGKPLVEDQSYLMGRTGLENIEYLKNKYGLEGEPEQLLEERRSISDKIFEDELELLEGVEVLVKRLRQKGIKCAIGSGGRKSVIEPALRKFGFTDFFDVIIDGDDVEKGKPDPEVFLLAAKKLGVDPSGCLVLEDAPNGIEAAKAAGMKAVFVPDLRFVDGHHEKADAILETLQDLTDDLIESLSKKR
jgi:HAD superfamily hydrolase (TIGR01509 family)